VTNKAKYAVEAFTQFANSLDDAGVTFEQLINAVVNNQPEEEKPWPENGEIYYHIGADGTVNYDRWQDQSWDKNAKELGIYKTQEQAEQIAQNRKVHTMLKELAGGFVPDWDNEDQDKSFLVWCHFECTVKVFTSQHRQSPSAVYFNGIKDAKRAIKTVTEKHGKDAIKKYCLYGVI